MKRVAISASLDDMRYLDFRFIEEAAKLGVLRVLLWSDKAIEAITGSAPKFPQAEREYLARSIRWMAPLAAASAMSISLARRWARSPARWGWRPRAWVRFPAR